MKRKVLAALLVAAMAVASMTGCGSDGNTPGSSTPDSTPGGQESQGGQETPGTDEFDYGSGNITIWVANEVTDLTKQLAEGFLQEKGYDYTVTVEAVGEGDAAKNMLTDVAGGADLYSFAQDQMARLVAAGALQQVSGTGYDTWVAEQNDGGAVGASKVGETVYAFPMTSDNGYFLYYDSSVVTDPTTLEGVAAACEAAGKNFYFEINSGWYQTAFFFATGCQLTYDTNDDSQFVNCNIDYASDQGLVALKEMIELASSKSFQNGSDAGAATNVGAIVTGTWNVGVMQEMLGENYACVKLPVFTGCDGKEYQLSGFGGFKLLGVKPQTEAGKLRVCLDLAQYLTAADAQLARFNSNGWGPSNLTAQADEAVQSNPALSALAAQLAFTIPQGQYPDGYWSRATSLADDIISGNISTSTSDDDLKAILEQFQNDCISYANAQ
ncbi:MAG: extracellular solute-binding protein [Roseburia sp.]|nr:extracellular solute-binding protein [Roseburia sp.]MCM1097130.1 extracellular solute-binding protein [Ruminococcus flavefaciens]